MDLLSPLDMVFAAGESREHPMHVGALQLFEPPADSPDFARSFPAGFADSGTVQPLFRRRPARILGTFSRAVWADDSGVDLEYHLRRSALPAPGHSAELLELVSRLHGGLLDRHRPLWEAHVVEGLADGRIAVYLKLHHALIDGMSGRALLQRTLSTNPNEPTPTAPWSTPRPRRNKDRTAPTRAIFNMFRDSAREAISALPAAAAITRAALSDRLTLPMSAPPSPLNLPIGGARQVAVRSWPLERIRLVGKATGATVNDIVLAMSAAALRRYLSERAALPDRPLIAMVPVALRDTAAANGGNALGMLLCNLGTHLDDPAERLRMICDSTAEGKRLLGQLTRLQIMALSALLIAPLGVVGIPGFHALPRMPFNVIISNVPGSTEPLYYRGARLDCNYPLGIPFDGQALNISVATTGTNLDFGLVGCRRTVAQLPRLLDHLEHGLAELERATL